MPETFLEYLVLFFVFQFFAVPALAPVLHQRTPSVRQSVVDMTRQAWVEDSKVLELQCVSKLGRPGAILHWKIGGRTVVPKTGGSFVHDTLVGKIHSTTEKDRRRKGL